MTRVEKYREYRKEIVNSFYFEEKTGKKSEVSKKISEATLNKDTTNSLSVDEVLDAYEIYDEQGEVDKKKQLSKVQRKQLIKLLIAIGVVVVLVAAVIVVGILAFGGK